SGVNSNASVKVLALSSDAVAGVEVVFAITAGGGSLTGATATTNASGVATLGSWTVGGSTGTATVTATVTGLTPVTFNATVAQPGVAVELAITQFASTVADRATIAPAFKL